MNSIESAAAELRQRFEATNAARETALKESREIIRLSSRSIRAVHRQQFDDAAELFRQTREKVEAVKQALVGHPELFYAGYVHDSQKEFVEAAAVYAMVLDQPIPTADELGVEAPAYLNGLAEAGSECRRYSIFRTLLPAVCGVLPTRFGRSSSERGAT
jgi:translin